jgi:hypothetical protein
LSSNLKADENVPRYARAVSSLPVLADLIDDRWEADRLSFSRPFGSERQSRAANLVGFPISPSYFPILGTYFTAIATFYAIFQQIDG